MDDVCSPLFVTGVAIAPLIVETEGILSIEPTIESHISKHKYYYFWFFGYVAKLPYQREVETNSSDFPGLPRPGGNKGTGMDKGTGPEQK